MWRFYFLHLAAFLFCGLLAPVFSNDTRLQEISADYERCLSDLRELSRGTEIPCFTDKSGYSNICIPFGINHPELAPTVEKLRARAAEYDAEIGFKFDQANTRLKQPYESENLKAEDQKVLEELGIRLPQSASLNQFYGEMLRAMKNPDSPDQDDSRHLAFNLPNFQEGALDNSESEAIKFIKANHGNPEIVKKALSLGGLFLKRFNKYTDDSNLLRPKIIPNTLQAFDLRDLERKRDLAEKKARYYFSMAAKLKKKPLP